MKNALQAVPVQSLNFPAIPWSTELLRHSQGNNSCNCNKLFVYVVVIDAFVSWETVRGTCKNEYVIVTVIWQERIGKMMLHVCDHFVYGNIAFFAMFSQAQILQNLAVNFHGHGLPGKVRQW